jgi:LysR family transcriptional regulator of abg operon
MVTSTDTLSIFPWPLIEVDIVKANIRALPLRETLDETLISVISRRGAPLSPAAVCFIDCLRETVRAGSSSNDPYRRRLFRLIDIIC